MNKVLELAKKWEWEDDTYDYWQERMFHLSRMMGWNPVKLKSYDGLDYFTRKNDKYPNCLLIIDKSDWKVISESFPFSLIETCGGGPGDLINELDMYAELIEVAIEAALKVMHKRWKNETL